MLTPGRLAGEETRFEDAPAQLGKIDPVLLRRHRYETVTGHARHSVDFKNLRFTIVIENEIDTPPAFPTDIDKGL
jgi:hypothetical protein